MTRYTNRNDIKPMFFGVSFVVVVMLCLVTTGTLQGISTSQLATFNSTFYSSFGIGLIPIFLSIPFLCYFTSLAFSIFFANSFIIIRILMAFLLYAIFVCLAISFKSCFDSKRMFLAVFLGSDATCFFTFSRLLSRFSDTYIILMFVLTLTLLTLVTMPIRTIFAFRKFRNRFWFFANTADFRYNFFRHGLFPYKRLLLGPIVGYTPVVGSLYYNTERGGVK